MENFLHVGTISPEKPTVRTRQCMLPMELILSNSHPSKRLHSFCMPATSLFGGPFAWYFPIYTDFSTEKDTSRERKWRKREIWRERWKPRTGMLWRRRLLLRRSPLRDRFGPTWRNIFQSLVSLSLDSLLCSDFLPCRSRGIQVGAQLRKKLILVS